MSTYKIEDRVQAVLKSSNTHLLPSQISPRVKEMILSVMDCQTDNRYYFVVAYIAGVIILSIVTLLLKKRLFRLLTKNNTQEIDLRLLFHMSRVVPWSLIICLTTVILFMESMAVKTEGFPLVQESGCVGTIQAVWAGFFVSLLSYDVYWIGFVFRTMSSKVFLLLHHATYIIECLMVKYEFVEYIYIVFQLIMYEESQEVVASISYIQKGSKIGPQWLLFTVAWRLICTSFAVGVVSLVLLIGEEMKVSTRIFLFFQLGFWALFLWMEWWYLCSLLQSEKKYKKVKKEESADGSESSSENEAAPTTFIV